VSVACVVFCVLCAFPKCEQPTTKCNYLDKDGGAWAVGGVTRGPQTPGQTYSKLSAHKTICKYFIFCAYFHFLLVLLPRPRRQTGIETKCIYLQTYIYPFKHRYICAKAVEKAFSKEA